MACYRPGYDEERFEATISRNFICSICFNVLRDPVLCPRNQHCFCRACITKYLENSQRCPTCADELTVETLTEPQRMLKDYLNELNIHCKYAERGCNEIVQLQHLDRHEATCGFTPVVCKNQGCGVTVNKRDKIHHESELCEFRKLKCHSCGEMTKTLADMEKRIEKVETKMTNIEKNTENLEKKMDKNMVDIKTDMEGKFEAVNNEVRGLKGALIEGFSEMKDVLVKVEDMMEQNTREVRGRASGDKEKNNIIVAGGYRINSVETFNWHQKLWSLLQPSPKTSFGAISFVHDNHMIVAGGCDDNIISMNVDPDLSISTHWSDCPVKLPTKLAYHSGVLHNDQLIVTGGFEVNLGTTSDCIFEVQLVPPYTLKTLSRMPEPRQNHGTEIFGENVFIVGGTTTDSSQNTLNGVVLYDLKKNECKQLASLPYEVTQMATVKWGDNIVVIGGIDKHGKALDTVIIYNVKTEQHNALPSMKCKRGGCTAVVIRDNIVVLGGMGEQGYLKTVESFNFDRYSWEDLPDMSIVRWFPTAVAV